MIFSKINKNIYIKYAFTSLKEKKKVTFEMSKNIQVSLIKIKYN